MLKHRLVRKFTGQQMREDVIRSCFGGVDEDFVLSGSEGPCFSQSLDTS